MTLGAGLALALCLIPQLHTYVPFLTAIAGILGGSAHVPQPGAKAELEAVKGALAESVARE